MTTAVWTWKPLSPHEVELGVDALYAGVNGYGLSHRARDRDRLTAPSFVYGETLAATFFRAMESVKPTADDHFLDLGSGIGRAAVLALLGLPVHKVTGIEYLSDLHEAACEARRRLPIALGELNGALDARRAEALDFIQGSFLETALDTATLVFTVNAVFEPALNIALAHKLSGLALGARVVSVGQPLSSLELEPVTQFSADMGWGESAVFTYLRSASRAS